ncbi:MAG: class I SAM-dependent methyltransferase [Ignavibacteriales bacterium]|nr:class I SAM-dependent methyltransferase [Ignavibacteriales bacterium]
MEFQNKDHWYDGLFYDKIIAPNQDKAYRIVRSLLSDNCSLLDVGCGTGRLAFQLVSKFSRYEGIDPSKKNIELALNNLSKSPSEKISFHHTDAKTFMQSQNKQFDFAVISYVIHEVDEDKRENLLLALSESVNKIIVVDYLYPRPNNFWSFLNEFVEFAAGKEHYRNFKSYLAGKGIGGLAGRTGLKIVREIKNSPSTSHIVVLTK